MASTSKKIEELLKKGVIIPDPCNVCIGDDVDTDRISANDVTIYPGCRIYGNSVLVLDKSRIGSEGPVVLENCQVGPDVNIKSGFFKDSVFLKGAVLGSGSHIREGTILEEESSIAHTVGLKQTILFPYVTLGSLINFCDCLMSGGTEKKNHSEVGSSYIHFNYTPAQDKATPSLIGDVPNGVMLKQKPIFLGGQGGLVGPIRLAFGTTVAAGTICRKDELRPGRLIFGGLSRSGNIPYTPGDNRNMKRILANNIIYISNLTALMHWYSHVRYEFISADFPEPLLEGLKKKLDSAISERLKRLREFCEKNEDTAKSIQMWDEMKNCFASEERLDEAVKNRDLFLEKIHAGIMKSGKEYLSVIKNLKDDESSLGTNWLQAIVDIKTFLASNILVSG
jgi:UDP-N-acetylglucosamine/UDP-N-acetylgalactosamine diphosphorylase